MSAEAEQVRAGDLERFEHEFRAPFFAPGRTVAAAEPVSLVVDGHSIHKARIVREFVEEQNGRRRQLFLPPYSPPLNPDEQVWGNVKAHIAKQTVANKIDLKEKAVRSLERLCALP